MKLTSAIVLSIAAGAHAFQARVAPWTGFQARAGPWTGFQAAPWTRSSSVSSRADKSLAMTLTALSDAEYKASLEAIGGYDVETGGKPLDPLKLAKWIPAEKLRKYETTHCRVAMLACVGYAFPQLFGMFDASDVTSANGIDALFQTAPEAWAQIIGACGIAEAQQWKHQQSGAETPFYDPFRQWPKSAAKQEMMKMRELKNGRAAMLCWASFISADLIAGSVPDFAIPF